MRNLAMALLLACSGQAVDAPTDIQMAQQDVAQPQERGWCCDAWDEQGTRYLECGLDVLPADHADIVGNRCYCAGIADLTDGTCAQTQPYLPGTFCGQSTLVCW